MDRLMLIDELFKVDPFSLVNIVVIQKIGLVSAIVCNELEQRQVYWNKKEVKEWYATYADIIKKTGLSKKQVIYAVKKLCDIGLVHSDAPVYKDEIKVKYYRFDFNAKDNFMKSKVDGSVSESYSEDKFIIYSKSLAQKIGPECTLILRDLCTSYREAAKRDNLVDGYWFKYKRSSIAEKINLAENTMSKYINKLVDYKVIDKRRISNSMQLKINDSVLLQLFGFESWEELSAYIDNKQREKDKKKMTTAESKTIRLLDNIKNISGKNWELSFRKVADVEELTASGYTEKQLIDIANYVYENHKDDDEFFNWNSLYKKQTNYWMECINKDSQEEREKLKIKVIVQSICSKMREHTNGKVDWIVDDDKIKLIAKCVNCDEKFTEDELIQFAIGRYDDNTKHRYVMTPFEKLYTEKDNMIKSRELHKKIKYRENKVSDKTYKNEHHNDNVTTENDLRGKIDQDSITGVKGEDYF